MKLMTKVRKWSRNIHRDLSYILSGMLLVYALSGLIMNHKRSINPHYSVARKEYVVQDLPNLNNISKEVVINKFLKDIDEADNYRKHYFPKPHQMKVFLRKGSNLRVNFDNHKVVYEKLRRRPIIGAFTRLHYNPGKAWTWFSDIFAIGMMVIIITGIVMMKGKKGIWGIGGIELLIGILIPILFILLG